MCGHLYFFSSFFGTWTFWVRYRCFLLKPYSYFCKTSVCNCRSWVPWRQKTREHLHGASVRSSAPWGSSDLQISERVGRMLFVNVSVCFTEFWWIFVGVWIDTWYTFFSVSLVLMNTTNFYRPTLLRRKALQQIASFWRLEKFFFSLLFKIQMSDAFLKEGSEAEVSTGNEPHQLKFIKVTPWSWFNMHRTMSWATHWEKRQKSEIGQDIFCVLILVLFIIVYSIWSWFYVWTVLYILLLNLFEMILNSHCWTPGWWRCQCLSLVYEWCPFCVPSVTGRHSKEVGISIWCNPPVPTTPLLALCIGQVSELQVRWSCSLRCWRPQGTEDVACDSTRNRYCRWFRYHI